MCAWPKGKPRGPRKQSPFSLEQVNSQLNPISVSAITEEDQSGENDNVMPVGAESLFGIRIDSNLRSCTVLRRRVYRVETSIQYPSKDGQVTKVYKPGDFGEWEQNNATYHSTPEQALDYIAGVMRKQKLKEANDITKYLQICREVNAELKNVLKV